MDKQQALLAYARLFETVSPEVLDRLEDYFTPEARFKDPFNDVHGIAAIRHVFKRMFETCLDISFDVHHALLDGDTGLLQWSMRFRPDVAGLRRREWNIDGASRIRMADDGRICEHIDYWDSGEYFYARLPLFGGLLRLIRARVG